MKKVMCNPININYRYQFNQDPRTGALSINREAADPSMIYFGGRYYIFASMTLGVWVSDDLVNWENHRLPDMLPLYDYAPDVRAMGEYVYLSASKRNNVCNFYRTKDILNGPYEEIPGSFPFWDPNLFLDDDGRAYFYWGCATETPIYGVELDRETMQPIGERQELIFGDPWAKGFERVGVDHSVSPRTDEEVEAACQGFFAAQGIDPATVPAEVLPMIRGMFSQRPFVEGDWMDKFNGKYYLQYACPGTEYNIYADGVYVSDHPLGPFQLAENNPYSYHPGGFMPGAGHGSTMRDQWGNLWHASTMRISVQHSFERRVGIWPAGVDKDGELFCNQRYGDWPIMVTDGRMDPWAQPEWYLLSFGKTARASSSTDGHEPSCATDENVQTWWQAASTKEAEWLEIDLGQTCDVRAIQINFADDKLDISVPGEFHTDDTPKYIDDSPMVTRWKLEGSADGETYVTIEDKYDADTDLTHDLIVRSDGMQLRYLRLVIREVPYGQKPCVSGLRVFGRGNGERPEVPSYQAVRAGDLDFDVTIEKNSSAVGWNILWGQSPDKLYHSYMVFKPEQRIGALVKGRNYYVRVDAFNENGITEGICTKL